MFFLIKLGTNVLELGLIFSLVVLAVHISSNIISFDDLSCEGSFAAGGALTAFLLHRGVSSWLVLFCAIACGALVGIVTGLLHTKLKLNNLISGIVVTAALFSINLKIAGASVVLPSSPTILDGIQLSWLQPWSHVIELACMSFGLIGIISWLLRTEIGFLLRAVGSNPRMLTTLGKNIALFKIIGLATANSIIALSGALLVLHVGFFSITGSIGTLAIAFAGLIIGRALCKSPFIGAIIGALGYQIIIASTIEMQCDPVWNKLITALLIVILISIRNFHKQK